MGSVFGQRAYQPPRFRPGASDIVKVRYIPKVTKHEETLQRQVCNYLRKHHPEVIFRSDYASGLHMTQNQARIHKALQSSRSWPDLFIYFPARGFHGLAIELKKDGTTIYATRGANKGDLVADPHIREQAATLQELNRLGYLGRFGVGYDQTIRIIEWYLGNATPDNAELF